jgi:alanine dehydrogenase
MTLHISEADVQSILTMPMAITAVEDVSHKQAKGEVLVHPRRRFELPGGSFFHHMAAVDLSSGFLTTKQYTYVHGKLRFLVSLWSMTSGELLALLEADYLGQLRTGAASGVATKYLARQDAKVAASIGTGGQAKTQLEAIAVVRKLESVRAYGRDVARREKFCQEMTQRLGIPVNPTPSSSDAVRDAHIVSTATTASHPVIFGADLSPGAHINAIGANHARKRELDDAAVEKSNVIFVDSIEQSRQESGDLIQAFCNDDTRWSQVRELADLVAGKLPGRTRESQITLFKSNGIAAWDLAVAAKVYSTATRKNLGRELPFYTNESSVE